MFSIGDRVINMREINNGSPYYGYVPIGSVGEIVYKGKVHPELYKVRFYVEGNIVHRVIKEWYLCLV